MRKILSLFLSITLLISGVFCGNLTASAVGEDCIITVNTVTAITGDEVLTTLRVSNNPGIMAMTISITYNPDALEYLYYYRGIFSDYTIANHTDRKLIRLVISEEIDIIKDGFIAGFRFKVKDDAEFDFHEITIDYSSGDFCNNDLQRLMPTIVPGGVDVQYNGSNCSHKTYGDWEEVLSPSCESVGQEMRVCKKCNHQEYRDIEPIGHEFSNEWTVDVPATKDSYGVMSRHCIRCPEVTDETNFSLENATDGDIKNEIGEAVPDNEVVKDIILEQHPDINSNNSSSSSDNSSSSGDDNSEEKVENSVDANTSSDDTQISDSTDKEKTEEQINDIINILSPDNDNSEETAKSIAEVIRNVFPNFDNLLKIVKIAFTVLGFILIL